MKIEVNIGDKFGDWEVIANTEPRSQNEYWLCKCKCGTEKEVFRGSLLNSRSKSCGCSKRKRKVLEPAKRR